MTRSGHDLGEALAEQDSELRDRSLHAGRRRGDGLRTVASQGLWAALAGALHAADAIRAEAPAALDRFAAFTASSWDATRRGRARIYAGAASFARRPFWQGQRASVTGFTLCPPTEMLRWVELGGGGAGDPAREAAGTASTASSDEDGRPEVIAARRARLEQGRRP